PAWCRTGRPGPLVAHLAAPTSLQTFPARPGTGRVCPHQARPVGTSSRRSDGRAARKPHARHIRVPGDCRRPAVWSGAVQVRYRYRLYPSPGQQQALARVFGCARVVYNDCLRVRDQAYAAGEKINDTEVQRRVITLAKATPERAWLAGVASVALVQACQDARRAYRNWFDSLSGIRKGRRTGRPRFRSKRGRQSIRLTRNGFALHGARLYVAKVGDLKVRWSRDLPSVPSSVTVIKEPDGRYYASFVERGRRAAAAVRPGDR